MQQFIILPPTNRCNLSTEEKYTNFFNHLVCESMRLEQERGAQHHDKNVEAVTEHDDIYDDDNARNHHGHGGIELLPIVTRGCLCELAKTIGFDPQQIEKSYSFSNQMIQTFRRKSDT